MAFKFALMGAAGYVAPRHMKAIRETGNELLAAFDPNDSVGVIDGHFPDAKFFTEFERFDRYIDKLKRAKNDQEITHVSICSPNYLHDSHIRFAMRSGADAICEKPLVLNPWNIDALSDFETDCGKKVNTILQLRLHPAIIKLKERYKNREAKADVDLTYITSRGNWYLQSWKGDTRKSGGIATNIGVHFFDMLHFVFGDLQRNEVHQLTDTSAAGYLEYDGARVRWFLSIDNADIPEHLAKAGQRTFRAVDIDGELLDFTDGFTDLHTRSYEEIVAGRGFGLEESRTAIATVAEIRTAPIVENPDTVHPFLQ